VTSFYDDTRPQRWSIPSLCTRDAANEPTTTKHPHRLLVLHARVQPVMAPATPRSRALLRAAVASLALAATARACGSDLDCSLNGVCSAAAGACVCDAPWSGPACATLAFAVTPASAKNIYPTSDPHNTWSGPIAGPDADGFFHAFVPLYQPASLWHVITTMHGKAAAPTGPFDWAAEPNISSAAINPGFLEFVDGATGRTVYSLWTGGDVLVADSLGGPFVQAARYSGVNPAPVFSNGSFFLTTQHTTEVLTAPSLAGPWSFFANITHPPLAAANYTVEDPRMWVDRRGNFHILNHAYNTREFSDCGASHVSAHFFSGDGGRTWLWSDQPYGHTVQFDDGSQHTYATLERPYLVFDAASGRPAFLVLAADLVAQEACPSPSDCCDCCKFADHAGTLVVKLAA